MSEYIERGALLEHCYKQPRRMISDISISMFPSADVVEVKHGEWEKVSWWQHQNRYECNECSLCGCRVKPKFTYNFCPNCGAKMDGKGEGE